MNSSIKKSNIESKRNIIKVTDYVYFNIDLIQYTFPDSQDSSKIKIYYGPNENPANSWIRITKKEFDKYLKPYLDKIKND